MIENVNKNDKIEQVDVAKLRDFPNHPYRIKDDEEMKVLMDSAKEMGINTPLIVRKKEDGRYEIISGHRRKYVARKLGIRSLNCIVKDISDDEATILMVDSNIQREELLPSEKAFAYKMKLEAMKHQGKKVDFDDKETSVPVAQKLENKVSREVLGEEVGESQDQIRRYIRLTYLIPELLEQVDEKRIAFRTAVELSYLSEDNQYVVYDKFDIDQVTPSLTQAIKLKQLEQKKELDGDKIVELLDELKPNQKDNKDIKFFTIKRFFPKEFSDEEITNKVYELLKNYYQRWRNKDRDREER